MGKVSDLAAITALKAADILYAVQDSVSRKIVAADFGDSLPVKATGSTTARTLAARFADNINVKDFGAVLDGVADDATAFQAFLTHLAANGGVGQFSGTLKINSQVSITSNAKPFRLIGAGRGAAKIVVGADIGTPLAFTTCSEIIIEGFSLDCQFSSFTVSANHGISISDGDNILVRDVHVEDYKNTAVLVTATAVNTHSNVILDNVSSDGLLAANNGLLIADMNESGIRNCRAVGATGSPGYGLQLKNDSRRCFIEDSFADNCVSGLAFGVDGVTGVSQGRVSNVFSKGSSGSGFIAGKATNNKITGLLVDMESLAENGIDLQDGCVSNDVEASVYNIANAKGAVRTRSGALDNIVMLTHLDNNNASGKAAIFDAGSTENTVILGRGGSITSTDPYDLVTDNSSGSTNIFDYKVVPLYQKLTIATGVITLAHPNIKSVAVDTESAGAADDLVTINGGVEGAEITLRQEIDARDVTLKHGTGNILLDGLVDLVFTGAADTVRLRFSSRNSAWCEVGRGNNV